MEDLRATVEARKAEADAELAAAPEALGRQPEPLSPRFGRNTRQFSPSSTVDDLGKRRTSTLSQGALLPKAADPKVGQMQNRQISSLLAEPDVIQVLETYRDVFEELYRIYADEDSDTMDFARFLQFCQDFRIVPRICSTHELLQVFKRAECLDPPRHVELSPDEPETPRLKGGRDKSGSKGPQAGKRRSVQVRRKSNTPVASEDL